VVEQTIKQAARADTISASEDLGAWQAGLHGGIPADGHIEERGVVAIAMTKIDIDRRAFVADQATEVTKPVNADEPTVRVAVDVDIDDGAQAFCLGTDGQSAIAADGGVNEALLAAQLQDAADVGQAPAAGWRLIMGARR
jgi:hypothetical protein